MTLSPPFQRLVGGAGGVVPPFAYNRLFNRPQLLNYILPNARHTSWLSTKWYQNSAEKLYSSSLIGTYMYAGTRLYQL